jgi:hypothetical protein
VEHYEKNFSAHWFPEGASASSSSDEKLGILNGEKFVLIHVSSLQCEVHRVENCTGFAPTATASNLSNHVIVAQKNRFSVRSLQTWELKFDTDMSDLIEEKGIFIF